MNKNWSLGVKLTLFALFAIVFAIVLIAFSGKYHKSDAQDYFSTDNDGKKNANIEYRVNPNDNLFLDVDFGDVTIDASDDNKVHIKAVLKGSDEELDRYDLEIEQDGNTVRVVTHREGSRFRFFEFYDLRAKYEITVPKEFNLDLSTSGGNIKIYGVKGDIKGNTSGGDVEVEKLEGNIDIGTSGGNVFAAELKGSLRLETSGGDITVEKGNGHLKAETSGGNIKITDTDAEINASTSGGNIKAWLHDNKGVRLSTSGGNISLYLPETISGDLDADATGGSVNCDFPFKGKIEDDYLRGTINGGGNEISLETTGGNIDIASRND